MAMSKTKILVIGATGYIGKFIAYAGAALHHPTFALVRRSALSSKAELISSFKASGITILEGSLDDYESLVAAIKQVDVVISTVGVPQILEQTKIISAIKEAGTIKRFFPSEFASDVDHAPQVLEPAKSLFEQKAQIRRAVEEAQIPYTYLVSNGLAETFLANLYQQTGGTSPPRDKVLICGTGNVKLASVLEDDVATYTVKAMDDPRTLNKTLHIRLPANIQTQNELVALWEKKIGKTLEKEVVSEESMVKQIEESPKSFFSIVLAILHDIAIKGDLLNFDLGPGDVEASTLYPEVKYTTTEEFFDKFV